MRRVLEDYASRGVFRSFSPVATKGAKSDFRFFWLWGQPFRLTFDEKLKTIAFPDVLPNIERGSDVEVELKAFLDDFTSPSRPEHRRLDPARIVLRYSNPRGKASVTFRVRDEDYEYAVQRSMDVVNETFLMFLHARYPEYLVETFGLPEE